MMFHRLWKWDKFSSDCIELKTLWCKFSCRICYGYFLDSFHIGLDLFPGSAAPGSPNRWLHGSQAPTSYQLYILIIIIHISHCPVISQWRLPGGKHRGPLWAKKSSVTWARPGARILSHQTSHSSTQTKARDIVDATDYYMNMMEE